MQPGKLDQLVTLKHKTLAPDGKGGSVSTFVAYASNVPAHFETLKGSERTAGSQRVEAMGLYLITMRNRSDMVHSDVIVWNGRTLNIRFIRDLGTRAMFIAVEAEMGAAP